MFKNIVVSLAVMFMATVASADVFEGTLKATTTCPNGDVTKEKVEALFVDYGTAGVIYSSVATVGMYTTLDIPTKKGSDTFFAYHVYRGAATFDAKFSGEKVKGDLVFQPGFNACIVRGTFKGKDRDWET